MNTDNYLIVKYFKLNLYDYIVGIHKGSWKLCEYIIYFKFYKIYYLLMSLLHLTCIFQYKVAIEKCRLMYTNTRNITISANQLKFGHPIDIIYDYELLRRIKCLKKIHKLTNEILDSICQSDAPIEIWNNIVLNGNGRLKALQMSNHLDLQINVIERF